MRARHPVRVVEDLALAPHSLRNQACQDRRGECHDSGWGLGWYAAGEPQVVRCTTPAFLAPLYVPAAERVESPVILGHVRMASVGSISEENCHPFVSGPWMFAHNGTLTGFDAARPRLLESLPATIRAGIRGQTDSEHVFAMILSILSDKPGDLGEVLAEAVRRCLELCPGMAEEPTRLNFVLTDGRTLAATRHGHSLFRRDTQDGVALASEPTIGDWVEVPDRSVLWVKTDFSTTLSPLL